MINLSFTEDGEWKRLNFGFSLDRRLTGSGDIVNYLQVCLDEISKPHPRCSLRLQLWGELITQPALALLVQLLNQPFTNQSSTTTEPSTNTGDDTTKWESVELIACRLALPDSSTALQSLEDKEICCAPDNIQIFVSTASLRAKSLKLSVNECPDILHAFFDAPQLEISRWEIEKPEFSALDCARLANSLQRALRPLTTVRLTVNSIEDPLVLVEALVRVKELSLHSCIGHQTNSPSARHNDTSLGDTLVGESGNSVVQRLLQHPLSQLKDLWLENVQLEDRHFMAMIDTLPTSQLEELSLSLDNISWHGIMALAQQLPRITSLKTIFITQLSKADRLKGYHEECCVALTQGMRENYSVETLFLDELHAPKYEEYLFSYYADLNHAGRRILVSSKPVPAGLWYWILERAGTKCFRRFRACTLESEEIRWKKQEIQRVNSIYFLLRNCQALLSVQ